MPLKVVGYMASDPFKDGFVSHQVQNLMIKNFVQSHGHQFLLSWTEYRGQAPLVLNSLLEEKFYDGICFYSLEQLSSVAQPIHFLQSLARRGLWTGFTREGLFFHTVDELQPIKTLYVLKQVIQPKDGEQAWA